MCRFPHASAAASLLIALAGAAAAEPRLVSTAEQRSEVSVTVYNQDLGLVREVRDVTLGRGEVTLEFRDVAATIQAETVHVQSAGSPGDLRVVEQNYQYDLLSPRKLLEKYVGRRVKIYRWNETTGRDEEHEAEVLASNEGTVLRIGNEITFDFPGRISFPEIPQNLIAKPTLTWLLASGRERQTLEVSYLARGLDWHADYVLVLDAADARASLNGWVTLANRSGASYRDARVKLVAGDVQRVQPEAPVYDTMLMRSAEAAAPAVREEGIFEYHLYTLERPTTLLDMETKQVALLGARQVAVAKRLVLESQPQLFRMQWDGAQELERAGVYLEFENAESNGLGRPLPKGVVRVYKADSEGAQQFLGEDSIDHTPRDEKVRLKTGEAFDVVAERRQMEFRSLGRCSSESAWQIELRNHKEEDVVVEVLEHAGGDWEIVESSHEAQKEDANSFRFRIDVPRRGAAELLYRLRLRWC